MTTSYTLHTQVTKTEDVRNRRRVVQQASSVRVLADKSYLEGKGVLNPGQTANMFGSAELLYLSSDQPLNISLLNPTTDAVVIQLDNTRLAAFDVSDTGDSYKVVAEVSGLVDPANIEWFAFDNLTVGSITGTSTMLQAQVNQNIADIAALQAALALLQANDATNTAAIATLQTQLTALQAQLVTLDTTVQANASALVTINATLSQLETDVTALQLAVAALETSQAAQDAAIAALQATTTTNAGDLAALQSAVTQAQADIVTNTNAVTASQNDVTANGTAITNNANAISSLQTAVTDNDNDILSLQQLMATTTQNVSDNTAAIAGLKEGGIMFPFVGTPSDGDTIVVMAPYAFDVKSTLPHSGDSETAPGTASVVTLSKGGVVFGTIDYTSLSTTPTFNITTDTSFAVGDRFEVELTTMDGIVDPTFTIAIERT